MYIQEGSTARAARPGTGVTTIYTYNARSLLGFVALIAFLGDPPLIFRAMRWRAGGGSLSKSRAGYEYEDEDEDEGGEEARAGRARHRGPRLGRRVGSAGCIKKCLHSRAMETTLRFPVTETRLHAPAWCG